MANETFITELGRGSFGMVAAVQLVDGTKIARKIFQTAQARDEELRSFQMLRSQQHPCIISPIKSGIWNWTGARSPVPYIDYPLMKNRYALIFFFYDYYFFITFLFKYYYIVILFLSICRDLHKFISS